jgi:hypothetical protein
VAAPERSGERGRRPVRAEATSSDEFHRLGRSCKAYPIDRRLERTVKLQHTMFTDETAACMMIGEQASSCC